MNKQKLKIDWIIATWFGSGLLPIAPGTWGSLAAFPFAYLISVYFGPFTLIIGIGALFFIGTWASNKVEKRSQEKDPRFIVVDEVVGQWIALLLLPFLYNLVDPDHSHYFSVPIAVTAFIAFRIFDIWKPWPIKSVEKNVPDGFGIMLDDVIAGIYALIITSAMTVVMVLIFL